MDFANNFMQNEGGIVCFVTNLISLLINATTCRSDKPPEIKQ